MSGYGRAYRAMIGLLPAGVRRLDGAEMLATFEEQLAQSSNRRAAAWRAFVRFPRVLALEWRDVLVSGGVPTPPPQPRGTLMDAITRMVKQGSRGLLRTPAFSLSVVALFFFNVTTATEIYTVVDHVLLR